MANPRSTVLAALFLAVCCAMHLVSVSADVLTFPPTEGQSVATTKRVPATTQQPPSDYCPQCVNSACKPHPLGLAVHVPYPGDCTKFCMCVMRHAVKSNCPEGLYFNADLQVCDWPNNSGCEVSNTYVGSCKA